MVIDAIKMDAPKTAAFKKFLKAVDADCKALVVTAEADELVIKSAATSPASPPLSPLSSTFTTS